jgi:hypothetical protein
MNTVEKTNGRVVSTNELIKFLETRWIEKNKDNPGEKKRGVSTVQILEFCGSSEKQTGRVTERLRSLFKENGINWECFQGIGWIPNYKIETKKEQNEEESENSSLPNTENLSSVTANFSKEVQKRTQQIPSTDPRFFAINALATQGLNFLLQVIQTVATMDLSSSVETETQTTEQHLSE